MRSAGRRSREARAWPRGAPRAATAPGRPPRARGPRTPAGRARAGAVGAAPARAAPPSPSWPVAAVGSARAPCRDVSRGAARRSRNGAPRRGPPPCERHARYDGRAMRVDHIFEGERLLTMDPARPRATALAVLGGRIVAVGDGDE